MWEHCLELEQEPNFAAVGGPELEECRRWRWPSADARQGQAIFTFLQVTCLFTLQLHLQVLSRSVMWGMWRSCHRVRVISITIGLVVTHEICDIDCESVTTLLQHCCSTCDMMSSGLWQWKYLLLLLDQLEEHCNKVSPEITQQSICSCQVFDFFLTNSFSLKKHFSSLVSRPLKVQYTFKYL